MENLTSLRLEGDDTIVELTHDMLQNLTSLESLIIIRLNNLKCLSTVLGSLSSLKYLHIADCHKLESFSEDALQGLGSLQVLSISHCVKFHSLPEGLRHLTSLERLVIRQCPDLVAFPDGIKDLHSLQLVELDGIQARPDGLQYISSLKCLRVSGCPNFVSSLKWLRNLISLRFLLIDFGTIPPSVPSTMRSLINLKQLVIRCCNPGYGATERLRMIPFGIRLSMIRLEMNQMMGSCAANFDPMRKRYDKDTWGWYNVPFIAIGAEWYKIARVPSVWFFFC